MVGEAEKFDAFQERFENCRKGRISILEEEDRFLKVREKGRCLLRGGELQGRRPNDERGEKIAQQRNFRESRSLCAGPATRKPDVMDFP